MLDNVNQTPADNETFDMGDKQFLTKMKDFILWLYWHPFKGFIKRVPVWFVYKIAHIGGVFLYHMAAKKRRALGEEYRCIFNYADTSQTEKVVKRTFINLCQAEAEMLLYSEMNEKNIHLFAKSPSFDNLEMGLKAGNGVMLLFAHFGANQMVMPAVGYRGYKMSQMSAPAPVWVEKMPNKKFSDMEKRALELRWEQELSLPVTHINIFGSLRDAFKCLKRNQILGIAIDGGGGKERMKIRFMDKTALFSTGAARLAVRTGCVVLPIFMVRTKQGTNQMIILSSIHPQANVSQESAIQAINQAFADRLTEFVRECPDHYLNFMALRRRMSQFGDLPLFMEKDEFDDPNNPYYSYDA